MWLPKINIIFNYLQLNYIESFKCMSLNKINSIKLTGIKEIYFVAV